MTKTNETDHAFNIVAAIAIGVVVGVGVGTANAAGFEISSKKLLSWFAYPNHDDQGWIYAFQSLIAGLLALVGAFYTVGQMKKGLQKANQRHYQMMQFQTMNIARELQRAKSILAMPENSPDILITAVSDLEFDVEHNAFEYMQEQIEELIRNTDTQIQTYRNNVFDQLALFGTDNIANIQNYLTRIQTVSNDFAISYRIVVARGETNNPADIEMLLENKELFLNKLNDLDIYTQLLSQCQMQTVQFNDELLSKFGKLDLQD